MKNNNKHFQISTTFLSGMCHTEVHWVQSKRHKLWFSTKTCSCYSTKTHVDSVVLILKLNLTSMRNIYIKMCVVLNEDHFWCICFSTKSNSIWGWGSCCLCEFSLSDNYTVFVENHNLWRFDWLYPVRLAALGFGRTHVRYANKSRLVYIFQLLHSVALIIIICNFDHKTRQRLHIKSNNFTLDQY